MVDTAYYLTVVYGFVAIDAIRSFPSGCRRFSRGTKNA